jgi:hypothetical protein
MKVAENISTDNIIIGRKSNSIDPGYVWIPYIISQSNPVVVDGYNPFRKSRFYESIPEKRIKKIDNILKNI